MLSVSPATTTHNLKESLPSSVEGKETERTHCSHTQWLPPGSGAILILDIDQVLTKVSQNPITAFDSITSFLWASFTQKLKHMSFQILPKL